MAGEEEFIGHFTEEKPSKGGGEREERGTMERFAEGFGEGKVGDGKGSGKVDGPFEIGVVNKVLESTHDIMKSDPTPPPPP